MRGLGRAYATYTRITEPKTCHILGLQTSYDIKMKSKSTIWFRYHV